MRGRKGDILYHYTSINVLALMLKHNTLRFTRLDKFEDYWEGYSLKEDLIYSKDMYASCWTDNGDETIAYWKMYTEGMRGVRISFNKKRLISSLRTIGVQEGVMPKGGSLMDPKRVIYTEKIPDSAYLDKEERYENIVSNRRYENYGLYKKVCWEVESEWRFRISFIPDAVIYHKDQHDYMETRKEATRNMVCQEFIDLNLTDEAWQDVAIMTGPRCTDSDEVIVRSLLKTYGKVKEERVVRSSIDLR